MDWKQSLDSFEFKDDAVGNHEIEPETRIHNVASILNRQPNLSFHGEAATLKFEDKAGFIDRLEQAWPKLRMNLK